MPCQVVNSQTSLHAQLPSLPAPLPKTQSDWTAFLTSLRQWGTVLQQQPHAPNIIPPQFQTYQAAAATPVLAALTATNCTPSIDTGNLYYGTASLKVASLTNPATLRFTGTPIALQPGTRWYCSFQILAPSGCTGSLEVLTNNGHSVTESFTVPSSSSWQQVWGLFDLTAFADPQATWLLTITSTANFNLDGLQMNAVGNPIAFLPIFAGTQMVAGAAAYAASLDGVPDGSTYVRPLATAITSGQVDLSKAGVIGKTLTNVADASGRYAVTNAASLNGVASVDGANLALIDFSQAGHTHKILDNIGDGSTYGRVKIAGLTSGVVDPTNGGLVNKGSYAPSVATNSFTYTCTTTSITPAWSGMSFQRPDGTTVNPANGSQLVTGLTANTNYYFYPYYDEASGTLKFVNGGTGTGSPAWAYISAGITAGDPTAAANMNLVARTPLNKIFAFTPTSGTGSGGGGGSGCPHPNSNIETVSRGVMHADDLRIGDCLRAPVGSGRITRITRVPTDEWVRVEARGLHGSQVITVSSEHIFYDHTETAVRAKDLRLGMLLSAENGLLRVTELTLNDEPADAVSLEIEAPHLYFIRSGGFKSHNPKP